MRASIVIAAHNEGASLWKTVRSCIESIGRLDYEILIADDASDDESVEEALRRFPQLNVHRHDQRQGASPTKHLGASKARGEVLVFLDGHCRAEPGAIQRLVEDVERLDGQSLVTPTMLALNTARWKNKESQVGHGYRLELDTFDCSWLPLASLRKVRRAGRQFYESPAAIGCAFAVHRELYDDLRGFDPHMRIWGVEDLDFSLKCWLMGHSIVHDPEARIGHRFRDKFDNYDVPVEHILVNKLRMAYKNFTQAVWSEWLERCRQEHPGRLKDHPEGLWACAWKLFEAERASAQQECAYLFARRQRDEFWYAERFGLTWPRVESAGTSKIGPRAFGMQQQASEEPSGSPPPPSGDVEILNDSRGSDRVVVGKIVEISGHNGGTKQIKVKVIPANTEVVLEIVTEDGTTGSAVFDEPDSGDPAKKTLPGDKPANTTHTISIRGRIVSSEPRNLALKAKTGGDVKATWDFTVFRIDLALLENEKRITEKAKNEDGQKLRDVSTLGIGTDRAGMFFDSSQFVPAPDGVAGGNELTIGTVVPAKMQADDFFRSGKPAYQPGKGFFIQRTLSSRTYLDAKFVNGAFASGQKFNADDQDDTSDLTKPNKPKLTKSQDLEADNDAGDDLFIYSWDAPQLGLGRPLPVDSILHQRFNFVDRALYDDTICSIPLDWHMHQSIKRKKFTARDPLTDFERDATLDGLGDNSIGGGHKSLKHNMAGGAASSLPFSVAAFRSPQASLAGGTSFKKSDPLAFEFTIKGASFPDSEPLTVTLVEISGSGPAVTVTEATRIDATTISGTGAFANRDTPGAYIVCIRFGSEEVTPGQEVIVSTQGGFTEWAFREIIALKVGDLKLLVGNELYAADALKQRVIPAPDTGAPTLTIVGGNVTATVLQSPKEDPPGSKNFKFIINVSATPADPPFQINLRAAGAGKTGDVSFYWYAFPPPS